MSDLFTPFTIWRCLTGIHFCLNKPLKYLIRLTLSLNRCKQNFKEKNSVFSKRTDFHTCFCVKDSIVSISYFIVSKCVNASTAKLACAGTVVIHAAQLNGLVGLLLSPNAVVCPACIL